MTEDRLAGESDGGEVNEEGFVLAGDMVAEAQEHGGGGTEEEDGALEEKGPPPEDSTNGEESSAGDFLPVDETSEEGTSEGDSLPVDETIQRDGLNDEEKEEEDAPADEEEPESSNETERNDDEDVGRRQKSKQYELLPGLPVVLTDTDDANVTASTLGSIGYGGDAGEGSASSAPREFFVSSTRIGLGRGSSVLGPEESEDGNGNTGNGKNFCAVVGCDVSLKGTIERRAAVAGNEGEIAHSRSKSSLVVRGLDVSIGGGASIDPLADTGHVLAFLREFAGSAWDEPVRVGRRVELSLPPGSLGAEICASSVDGSCLVVAKTEGSASPLREGDVIESMNGTVLAEVEGGLQAWVRLFKGLADGERTVVVRRSLPDRRLTLDEWEQFLSNVKSDRRASSQRNRRTEGGCDCEDNGQKFPPPDAFSPKEDILIPNARVGAFAFTLPDHKESIEFPACEGTPDCTLRTMLEYYCTAILRTIRDRSYTDGKGRGTSKGGGGIADMASVKGSVVGATVGGALLGPVGFLAGSYLGGQFGRKHSAAVSATAGACLFGPVGLIAGAAVAAAESGASSESSRDEEASRRAVGGVVASSNEFGASGRPVQGGSGRPVRSLRKSVSTHLSNNKLEYAGTTGVMAGAAVGAIAGPVGMLAGAYAGSVTARKGTEVASDSALETRQSDGRSGYQFGDVTRGLVARGKKARGADRNDKYKFGDFTRGLFSG